MIIIERDLEDRTEFYSKSVVFNVTYDFEGLNNFTTRVRTRGNK